MQNSRLILLYNLAVTDNDSADSIADYTYLANEFAAQHVVIECLADIGTVIKEELDEQITRLIRNTEFFIVGLDIEIRPDEIPTVLDIVNDFLINDGDEPLVEDDILGKIRLVNFEPDDISDYTFLTDIPEVIADEDDDDEDKEILLVDDE